MSTQHDAEHTDMIDQVVALMRSAVCVWCEEQPAAATSYLCESCALEDPGGVLRKPARTPAPLAGHRRDVAL